MIFALVFGILTTQTFTSSNFFYHLLHSSKNTAFDTFYLARENTDKEEGVTFLEYRNSNPATLNSSFKLSDYGYEDLTARYPPGLLGRTRNYFSLEADGDNILIGGFGQEIIPTQ